jgi:crossover junction endodeoxyribonuclease RuvC
MRVLGIDPGTATTGYGLVEETADADGLRLVECDVIRTEAGTPAAQRLQQLHTQLGKLIARLEPDVVAVEELFFSRNTTTALSVGQARGVILLAAAQAGLPVFEYTPLEVKQTLTGFGMAGKEQVQAMVRMLLALDEVPQPDDAADGAAVAICHLHRARFEALSG